MKNKIKKISVIFSVIFILSLLISFSGCTSNDVVLKSGRASSIGLADKKWQRTGPGYFEYIDETTIKFIRDENSKTYYFITDNVTFIALEDDNE